MNVDLDYLLRGNDLAHKSWRTSHARFADNFSTQVQFDTLRRRSPTSLAPEIAQNTVATPSLVRAVARAHDWVDRIIRGQISNQRAIAAETKLDERYVDQIIPLAFLAPDVLEMVLQGRQSLDMTLKDLSSCVAFDWETQRQRIAARAAK
jgi:hypothetical protein